MIYKERRSCSVESVNYSTLGKIHIEKVDDMFSKYPDIKCVMLDRIKEYDDSLKLFFEHAVCSIEYMARATVEV